MKIKNPIEFLLIILILAACAPAASVMPPTETLTPILTSTPIPLTPTITPTPRPENLVDAKDLSVWIEEYTHAYAGKVIVNGSELDASQLTDEIQKNAGKYTVEKKVNGATYLFFVVNGVPLAVREKEGAWRKAMLGEFATLASIKVGFDACGWEDDPALRNYANAAFISPGRWPEIKPASIDDFVKQIDFSQRQLEFSRVKGARYKLRSGLIDRYSAPKWLNEGNFSDSEIEQYLTAYIKTSMADGKANGISEWIVINEPYADLVQHSNIFYERLKGRYYDLAFTLAREADPEATLILNDNHNDNNSEVLHLIWETNYNLAKTLTRLKVNGKPVIDAMGLQMHNFDVDWIQGGIASNDRILPVLQKIKTLGLKIIVTEFDYDMRGYPGTKLDRELRQVEVEERLLTLFLENDVTEFIFWGIANNDQSWLVRGAAFTDRGNPAEAEPTFLDADYRPRRNYFMFMRLLFNKINLLSN